MFFSPALHSTAKLIFSGKNNRIIPEENSKGGTMASIKIMPCLDMKEGRVVKGIHFIDIRDAGDPVENAAYYQREGADGLAMLDIAATLENRKTRLEWVRRYQP